MDAGIETRCGELLLAFDGRVLEVFGSIEQPGGVRFHIARLGIETQELRKNRVQVELTPLGEGAMPVSFIAEEADMATLGPFLQQVAARIPPSS
jgi:hypothetical protein